MRFPRYWSQATVEERDELGRLQEFTKWGWSNESAEAAKRSARESARQTLRKFLRGESLDRYPYGGSAVMREMVIESLSDDNHDPLVVVSQNAYGSLVLNTAQAMFIDLDFGVPASPRELGRSLLDWLLRREWVPFEQRQETALLNRIHSFHEGRRDWGLRVYRTAAGFRLLATHDLFDPASISTRELLEAAGSDPLYVRLCQTQGCFRARLTPKPWRCGFHAQRIAWPHADESQRLAYERWQEVYERLQAGFATCRLVETLGPRDIHPALISLVELHDRFTRCDTNLPLA